MSTLSAPNDRSMNAIPIHVKPILSEWEGNVPKVAYGELFIPYGVSDYASRFATVPLGEVLAATQ